MCFILSLLWFLVHVDLFNFVQEALLAGDAEKILLQRKDMLQAALAKLLVRKKVKHVSDLMTSYKISGMYFDSNPVNGGYLYGSNIEMYIIQTCQQTL